MSLRYAVLGAGRQGTAAAYDMAKFGDAELVKVGDVNLDAAEKSAARVNQLLGREIARPVKVDVTDEAGLVAALEDVDAFLSAVPYWFNPGIARAAIKARASMCDLGGNTGLVFEQLKLDRE
ncbi:MAG TPA: saccharopine dehydrogenase NADP-binding domain-containing protein, partial [Bacillota bacterium]|nr:saccharopine dehydrogenase NADP-binding domain-containing protein [Bacillota bacterium]